MRVEQLLSGLLLVCRTTGVEEDSRERMTDGQEEKRKDKLTANCIKINIFDGGTGNRNCSHDTLIRIISELKRVHAYL